MDDDEWDHDFVRCLGVYLDGEGMDDHDGRGRPIRDDNFLLLINGHHEGVDFRLPVVRPGDEWHRVLDTHVEGGLLAGARFQGGDTVFLESRSLAVLSEGKQT